MPEKLSFLIVGNPRDSFWPEAMRGLPEHSRAAHPKVRRPSGRWASAKRRATDLLGLLGVKRGKSPTAEDIRSCLFPSVIAGIVDDRTFRVIALEAMPFAFLGAGSSIQSPVRAMRVSIESIRGRGEAVRKALEPTVMIDSILR